MNTSDNSTDKSTDSFSARFDRTGIPTLIARLIVGGVFVHHALAKIQDPVTFLKAIKQYAILPLDPPLFINLVAVTIPWIELVVGLCLLFGFARRAGAAICFLMLIVFTPAILKLALDVQAPGQAFTEIVLDCGCGGGPVNIARKLAENTGLILLSVWLMASNSQRFTLPLPRSGAP